jgi:hypothetical protein
LDGIDVVVLLVFAVPSNNFLDKRIGQLWNRNPKKNADDGDSSV